MEFGWWRAKPPEGREDGARPNERCQDATPSRPWLARGSDLSADEKTDIRASHIHYRVRRERYILGK